MKTNLETDEFPVFLDETAPERLARLQKEKWAARWEYFKKYWVEITLGVILAPIFVIAALLLGSFWNF